MSKKIIITGDFFIKEDMISTDFIGKDIIELFEKADFRIVNLEAPVTNNEQKNQIIKTGPHLNIPENIIKPIFKKLKVNLVTLANNHIMDYGAKGLSETIEYCRKNNIDYVGAGLYPKTADKPYTLTYDFKRIALLNFTENEWSNGIPGADSLDIIDNINLLKKVKKDHDIVIVVIHGGNENYDYPSPRMVKQYRFYAENGASAIIGHHPHCIGGYEVHQGTPIFYSLGNFIFSKTGKKNKWYEGLILELNFSEDNSIDFKLIPVHLNIGSKKVNLLEEKEKDIVIDRINAINKIIKSNELLKLKWNQFLDGEKNSYLMMLSPLQQIKSKIIKRLFFKSGLYKLFFNKHSIKSLLNAVRCEAHREVIIGMLEKHLNKYQK